MKVLIADDDVYTREGLVRRSNGREAVGVLFQRSRRNSLAFGTRNGYNRYHRCPGYPRGDLRTSHLLESG